MQDSFFLKKQDKEIFKKAIKNKTLTFSNLSTAFRFLYFINKNKIILNLENKIFNKKTLLLILKHAKDAQINWTLKQKLFFLKTYPKSIRLLKKSDKNVYQEFKPYSDCKIYKNMIVLKMNLFYWDNNFLNKLEYKSFKTINNKLIIFIKNDKENNELIKERFVITKSISIDKFLIVKNHKIKKQEKENNYINQYNQSYDNQVINYDYKYTSFDKDSLIFERPESLITYVYSIKKIGKNIELKCFHLGYFNKTKMPEINIDCSLVENKDYELYSLKSINFKNNFKTYVFKRTQKSVFFENKDNKTKNIIKLTKNLMNKNNLDKDFSYEIKNNEIKFAYTTIENDTNLLSYARVYNKLNIIKRKIILFQDRITKADDNAEHLYNFCLKNKELEDHKLYYVLDKNSKDWNRLKNKGFNLIKFGSFKHKILFLNANALVTSHAARRIYSPFGNNYFYANQEKFKFIFLQHGIIMGSHVGFLDSFNKKIDLFISSNIDEKNIIHNTLRQKNVKITGLARFDAYNIRQIKKNKHIVYTPSWNVLYKNDFENSEYKKAIRDVLNSKNLKNLLNNNNQELFLVMHPEFEKYSSEFKVKKDSKIKIVKANDINYNRLLNDASLMITDYSSILFDMLYMKKPVISYAPYKLHHENYFFDNIKEKMIDSAKNIDELENKIAYYMNNNYQLRDNNKKQIEFFFKDLQEKTSSKKIINEIKTIL